MYGWIKLNRSLMQHCIWLEKPFSKGQAWVDMLLCVNHEKADVVKGVHVIHLERGQTCTSERQLAERWGWSQGKVTRFLEMLERENMVKRKRLTQGTLISVVNYSFFQADKISNGAPTEQKQSTNRAPTETNKNVKNDNNYLFNNTYHSNLSSIFTLISLLEAGEGMNKIEGKYYIKAIRALYNAKSYTIDGNRLSGKEIKAYLACLTISDIDEIRDRIPEYYEMNSTVSYLKTAILRHLVDNYPEAICGEDWQLGVKHDSST